MTIKEGRVSLKGKFRYILLQIFEKNAFKIAKLCSGVEKLIETFQKL